MSTLSTTHRGEKALASVITNEIYELAEKEERKILRKERAEMRKLIPVEVSITPTQLRSRGNRKERVRYNYDEEDIYGIDEDKGDEDFEQDENDEPTESRRSSRKTQIAAPTERPTRWSNRLNNTQPVDNESIENNTISMDVDNEQDNMDTTPSNLASEMDTSPCASDMDTTPSQSIMDTSRSQSVVDMDFSRPQSVMEQ